TIARLWTAAACDCVNTTVETAPIRAVTARAMRIFMRAMLYLSFFPSKSQRRHRPERRREDDEGGDRGERAGRGDAAPGHRAEAVDRPSHRHHQRQLLEPCRKDECRHPGAAEHHHH